MLKYMHGISKNDHLKLVTLGLGAVMLVTACGGGSSSTTSTTQSGTFTHVAGARFQNQIPFSTTIGGVGLPGARISPMGVADNGGASGPSGANLWIFGGKGFDLSSPTSAPGFFNDLWRYNQATGQWMLESGSTTITKTSTVNAPQGVASGNNVPGSRSGGVAFTDAQNNIWIFGGLGCDIGASCNTTGSPLNDLWKFTPNSAANGGVWTWVSGRPQLNSEVGRYGLQGVAAVANVPGARYNSASTQDSNGNFYIYGGTGCDSTNCSNTNVLGDLWRFNTTTGLWTWLSGPKTGPVTTATIKGIYGTQGVASNANFPGPRSGATMYLDANNNIWIFGGIGCDSSACSSTANYLNDVWMFNTSQQTWTWVNGSNRANVIPNGTLFTQGVPGSIPVSPTPRTQASGFADPSGNFWIFGGQGFDINGTGGPSTSASVAYLNDAWKYTPATNQWTYVNGSLFANQFANYGTMGVAAFSNIPGSRYASKGFGDGAGNFWMYGGQGLASASSGSSVGFLSDLWKMTP